MIMKTQTKIVCFVIAALSFFGMFSFSFGTGETFKGFFVTKEGKTIVVGEFIRLKKRKCYSCYFEGNSICVPFTEIKNLTDLGNRIVLIEKRSGKKFKVKCMHFPPLIVGEYAFYDQNSEKYSEGDYTDYTRKIVFDEDFGELRKCQKCERTFPPDYLFCPYDKSELRLLKVK